MNFLKLTVAAVVLNTTAYAQTEAEMAAKPVTKTEAVKERATYEERATKQVNRISEIVHLDDMQHQTIKALYLESYPKIKEVHKAAGKDTARADAESKKIMKERRKNVEALLNKEQKNKLEAYIKANKDIDADDEIKATSK
ncbi:MAG: hypothetical protein JNK61_02960 [Bacteroidia bacterium]|nr:hypothetical protein [Bacteroidia bacterium]HQV00074.1 hypothetical protein [Bacteroidia bacterium]